MSWLSTAKSVASSFGILDSHVRPAGCELGRNIYRETKRSAQIANVRRPKMPLSEKTKRRVQPLFKDLDLDAVRIRTNCRLPPNKFQSSGSIYAMTFGNTIYWRDEFDESDPIDLVKLIHELVHVDQVRRRGGEKNFACDYGKGYVEGHGELPDWISRPTAYHLNPLEAEAYSFESQFRDDRGRVLRSKLPDA
jgi:hypothetical protein